MGRFWKDDTEVYNWGNVVADSFAGLANWEGVAYGRDAVETMRAAMHGNARDFLSLDPQKILDEWDRMALAAKDVCVDVSEVVTRELDATRDRLRNWHGAAADAFRDHVSNIRAFTGQQYEFMLETIRALAAMLLDIAVESAILTMEGGKLAEVVTTFVRHRDRLLDGYESELEEVAGVLERTQDKYVAWQPPILLPAKVNLDVRSPDFRYEAFMSKDMDPVRFGPIVERERQKFVAEQQHNLVNPDSPIHRRLAGGS